MGCVSSKSQGGRARNSLTEYQLSASGIVKPDATVQATDTAYGAPIVDLLQSGSPYDAPVLDLPQSDTDHGVGVPQSDTDHGVPVVGVPQSDTPYVYDDQTVSSSATPNHSLWDRYNPEQQGLILQSDQYRDVLRDKLPDLVQSVDVKPMMPVLRQLHVIDADKQERIELQATQADMVMRMVDHVQQGPLWRLHAFLRGLAVTNQEHLIEVLGLDRAVYEEPPNPDLPSPSTSTSQPDLNTSHQHHQKQHFYTCADSDEKLEIPMGSLPGLLQHCERSQRILMMTTLFGIDDNRPLDLTPIYLQQNPDCKVNQRDVQSTTPEELFLKLSQNHPPNTLLLEGDAGTGKSTFLRHYAHTCCKELTECHKKGPESPCEGHAWKLVTYIAAGSITGSQEAAIRDNLLCDEKLKDQVIAMINEDGKGVLVINDAMDEMRKQTEKESLRQYTISHQKDGSPKVLISARVSLCSIEGKYFDRHLLIKGFSLDQGMVCMQQYLTENHNLTKHPVLDHIISNRKDFDWVLINPLRVHILSELIAREAITIEDVKSLNTVKLLKVLEGFVVRRDEKRHGADIADKHSKEFYSLCLEHLLDHKARIDEADLPSTSPYLAFLSKHSEFNKDAKEDNFYEFSHEVFWEYMAMRGLIECLKTESVYKRAVLLLMCSNILMRNTLQLTCGYISACEPTLVPELVFIIQGLLILQTKDVVCEQNRLTKKLLKLPALIKETVPDDVISKGLTSKEKKTIDNIYRKIQKAFNQNARSLQRAGWFSNGLDNDWVFVSSTIHDMITGCIRQCSPSLQEEIYRQTVHKLLPCIRYNLVNHDEDGTKFNYDHFVFPISNGRWGEVKTSRETSRGTEISVSACCPSDIVQTLTHFYRHQAPPTGEHCVWIWLGGTTSLWGAQPGEVLTCDQWVPVLSQLLTHTECYISILTCQKSGRTPLCGLFDALKQIISATHTLPRWVHVLYGQVSEEQLKEFCVWAHTVNLHVCLSHTTVLLSADQDQDYVTNLHQRVQDMMSSKGPTTYMTPDGKTFQMPQE